MTSFLSLHTALSGIRAGQTGLDTAAHNVANASTPGYTRQRVELRARLPYASPVGPVGTGVDVEGIGRLRDAFLDARARLVGAELAWQDTTFQLLRRAEALLAEPDDGLTAELSGVWDAFDALASDPADPAARRQVVTALDTLAARTRAVAAGWDELGRDAEAQRADSVREAGDLLAAVADLNRRIADAAPRQGTPNDLLDERDRALDRLATLLGANFQTEGDGSVTVRLPAADGSGPVDLVAGLETTSLALGADGAVTAGGVAVVARAKAGALGEFVEVVLPERLAALDGFVDVLAGALNDQHAAGYDADGNPGGALLVSTGGARDLRVAADVSADPRRLAAAAEPGAAFDGRNAEQLASLRERRLGGDSLDERLRTVVVDLAGAVAGARGASDTARSLSAAATAARQSMHAVSLDEEMVAVVSYQRALEAASRVMTAVDQALDTLVNRTGVVGR